MPQYTRKLTLDAADADSDSRTIPCVVSSEFPVQRDGFTEILVHEPGAINLERSPLPVFVQHDSGTINIGVAENLKIVGRKLRGLIRFGKSKPAQEIYQDVVDGIIRNLSVGYSWDDYQNESDGAIRVTKWTPYECSAVGIGADPQAGFFRSESNYSGVQKMTTEAAKKAAEELRSDLEKREAPERERVESIRKLGHDNQRETLAIQAIESGASVLEFRNMIETASKPIRIPTEKPSQRTEMNFQRSYGNAPVKQRDADAYASGQWLRATFLNNEPAKQWCRDNGMFNRAMATNSIAHGGALVPEELSSEIIRLVEDFGIARKYCNVVTMNSDMLTIPRRIGGLTAVYVAEGAEISDSDASWDAVNLVARKLAVLSRYSSEIAEDAVIDMAQALAEEAAWGFAQAEDGALFNGDGTSTYGGINGIRNKILGTAGAVDAQTDHDTFAEIDATDLANLKAALPGYAQSRGKWYTSSAGYALTFERLASAAGGNSMMNLADGMRPAFLGHEIVISESMPTSTGDLSDVAMLLFGDLKSACSMGIRRDLRLAVDDSKYFSTDQLAFRATERMDIVAHDVGTAATAGAVVALVGH